jgi:hypothetical protein
MNTPAWLTVADIPVPVPPPAGAQTLANNTAVYMLAYAVYSALKNASLNFLSATPDPEYASPLTFVNALTAYAKMLTQNELVVPYAPPGWDPVAAARSAALSCFATLSRLPVNAGDPNTVSVLMAWISGTGQLYGGHEPVPAAASSYNPTTGQGSVVGPSVL